jgi:deazaflavin-dependent oxidoreductase (nitroreductase family)
VEQLAQAQAQLTRTAFQTLNSFVRPAVESGIGNPWPFGGGAIILETTGRVSGEPRRVPLLASRFGDKLVVSTVRGNSQWLRNVEAEPTVKVWLEGKPRDAQATVCRGPLNTVNVVLD